MNWLWECKYSSKELHLALANFRKPSNGELCQVSYCCHLLLGKAGKRFMGLWSLEGKHTQECYGVLASGNSEHMLSANWQTSYGKHRILPFKMLQSKGIKTIWVWQLLFLRMKRHKQFKESLPIYWKEYVFCYCIISNP